MRRGGFRAFGAPPRAPAQLKEGPSPVLLSVVGRLGGPPPGGVSRWRAALPAGPVRARPLTCRSRTRSWPRGSRSAHRADASRTSPAASPTFAQPESHLGARESSTRPPRVRKSAPASLQSAPRVAHPAPACSPFSPATRPFDPAPLVIRPSEPSPQDCRCPSLAWIRGQLNSPARRHTPSRPCSATVRQSGSAQRRRLPG